jgi:hypothetical protein
MLLIVSLTVCSDITSQNILFIILTVTRTADLTEHTCLICKVILKTKHRHSFFIIKPTRCTNFSHLFWHETLHVLDSSSVHHQEFIHCTLGTGVCHTGLWTAVEQDQDGIAVSSWSCSTALLHIPLLSVQWISSWWWTDELSEACRVPWPKKIVKLVHLVGFIRNKFIINL